MNSHQHLTLEQEFNQRTFADQVQQMSREQAQTFLINLHKEMMTRENLYRDMLKDAWGIGRDDWFSDPSLSAS